jgi:hypothetical protein
MRLVSLPHFLNATRTARLAFLVVAVHQGTFSLAGAKQEVPIKGSIHEVETYDYSQFPMLFVDGIGSGNMTHLGKFTLTYEWEVNLDSLVGIGRFHFVAANGDSLFTEATGQASPTEDPDVLFTVSVHTIVGGTGRFDGASGQFTEVGPLNTVTGVRSSLINGVISR